MRGNRTRNLKYEHYEGKFFNTHGDTHLKNMEARSIYKISSKENS